MTTGGFAQPATSSKISVMRRSVHRAATPLARVVDPSLFYLVDEPSDKEESGPLKRRKIGTGGGIDMGEGSMGGEPKLTVSMHDTDVTSDVGILSPDAEIVSSSVAITVVPASDPSSSVPVEIPSSTDEAEKGVAGGDFVSDSDVDPEEERMFN
uniref:Uncharacterized protein LOC104245726 n=1 Tax=Nicotiana sylvestris TaxID=4096 RepID=A0A1U7YCK3_NICSY|nr:PREDICTED: uncharacterized protein LOC104245726 [Nicotiana sylvestris]